MDKGGEVTNLDGDRSVVSNQLLRAVLLYFGMEGRGFKAVQIISEVDIFPSRD